LPRAFDWIARLGGEEFVVVLPETDISGASVVAERLRQAVEATPFASEAGAISITVSVGVSSLACLPANQESSAQTLLDHAHSLVYRSKLAGRNRVTIADALAGSRE
jgi:diguanylate cyclase (GGDEF)-like protein